MKFLSVVVVMACVLVGCGMVARKSASLPGAVPNCSRSFVESYNQLLIEGQHAESDEAVKALYERLDVFETNYAGHECFAEEGRIIVDERLNAWRGEIILFRTEPRPRKAALSSELRSIAAIRRS